jgi:hypothetical protein
MDRPLNPRQFKDLNAPMVHPFIHEMIGMDERIRLSRFYGDVEKDKGFFITKEFIHIPYALPSLCHDMAHLLELTNSKRWTMTDWGMPRFEKDTMSAKAVFAALSRETRTRAIQLHISCFRNEEEKLASTSYNQLNNSYWSNLVRSNLPYGRFKTYRCVEEWVARLRERTYKAWSLDRIQHEWKVRLNHIQNWMETCPAVS